MSEGTALPTLRPGGREPLRHRPFRWLLLGRFANFLGSAVAPVALAFAVLDLTGSVRDLGLVVGARSLANVLLLLFGGVLADRMPRALLLRGSAVAAAATQGVVAAVVLTGTASIALLAGLSALNGAVAALSLPGSAALTAQTVPPHLVQPANAMLRLATNSALVGGAAAGGILVAAVGPGWGIAADAATFTVSALCYARIDVPDVHGGARDHPLRELRDGWTEFRSRTWVWAVVVQFMVVNAALTAGVAVLGPVVADDTFGRRVWGLVLAAQTLGMVMGGLIALRWQARRALLVGVALIAVEAVPLTLLGLAPWAPLLGGAMFVGGIAIEQFGVAWDVSLQQNVPPDRLARVYSYDMVGSFVAIPVGEVAVGPVAQVVGVGPALVGCGVLVLLATGAALLSGSVRALERLEVGAAAS